MNDRITALEERVAFAMWKAEADRAAPNVGRNRTADMFAEASDDERARWLSLARAALAASRAAPDCHQPDLVTAARAPEIAGPNSDGEYWLHINAGGRTGGINLGSEHGPICKRLLDAASRAASTEAGTAAQVRIKPLVWHNFDAWTWWAESVSGTYRVEERNGVWAGRLCFRDAVHIVYEADDFDTVIVACNDDNEARILSTLDLTPAPAVEPVAMTTQDAARVPEIAALIEAAERIIDLYDEA